VRGEVPRFPQVVRGDSVDSVIHLQEYRPLSALPPTVTAEERAIAGVLQRPDDDWAADCPAPAKNRFEGAIAALPGGQSTRLPGTLGLAEEFGAAVAKEISPFLSSATP